MPDTAGDSSRGSFVGTVAEKVKNDIYSGCTTGIEQRSSRHWVNKHATHARRPEHVPSPLRKTEEINNRGFKCEIPRYLSHRNDIFPMYFIYCIKHQV